MKENRNMPQSVTNEWFKIFFQDGAFLRRPNGQTYLWSGPWKKFSNTLDKSSGFVVHTENLIRAQKFFSSQAQLFLSSTACVQSTAVEVQKLLFQFFPDREAVFQRKDFSQLQKGFFEEGFRQIQGKIQRGEIEKAVPCSFVHSEKKPTGQDQVSWLKKLLAAPEGLYAYGFWNQDQGMMGATPEILFERDGNMIQSMALAGTMLRSEESNPQKLLKNSKERHEHQVVVEDLENQLSKIGWVKKGETKVMELPTLFHLMTPFEAEAGDKSDEELIRLLHPTPALGIHPRAFGFHWLEQLPEQKEREALGAPLLFQYGKKKSTCLVAIRNIQWGPFGSKIGAGCGIVEESELEKEWQEIQKKIDSIFLILGMK